MENHQIKYLVSLSRQAKQTMLYDASVFFPDECCGFMFGTEVNGVRTILEARAVLNHKEGDKRRRFEVLPADYMRAERYADEAGYQLLGIYHSHPVHPAIPSEHDRIAALPFFSYVILSVYPEREIVVRSWRLNEEKQFEEEDIMNSTLIESKTEKI